MSGEMSRSECIALVVKVPEHSSHEYLQPALDSGYIEMAILGKPNSRLQKQVSAHRKGAAIQGEFAMTKHTPSEQISMQEVPEKHPL